MICLRVADEGDGLQMWRVAANIMNKRPRTADNGWSSSLEIGRGNIIAHRKETVRYEMFYRASVLDGLFGTT
jgi:hypothetical protein